jgi:hypothetical protein
MRYLKYAVLLGLCMVVAGTAHAQVRVGVGVGVGPGYVGRLRHARTATMGMPLCLRAIRLLRA